MSRATTNVVLHPSAAFEQRKSDIILPDEWFLKLSLFQQLKKPPDLNKKRGALVLRHYQPGNKICEQGAAGWTAYSILTREDLHMLRDGPRRRLEVEIPIELQDQEEKLKKAATDKDRKGPQDALAKLHSERDYLPRLIEMLEQAIHVPPDSERSPLQVAEVILQSAQTVEVKPKGWFGRGARIEATEQRGIQLEPGLILDAKTRRAQLVEGQFFGEMSCMYRQPRSATVEATRECYVLELLRSIFDDLMKDPQYKARLDKAYLDYALAQVLREAPLFRELGDDQIKLVRVKAELDRHEPGTLICDEHQQADAMYLVRSGIVKVMKDVSVLLSAADLQNAEGLCSELRGGSDPATGARHALWQRLPVSVQQKLTDGTAIAGRELQGALNGVLCSADFAAHPAVRQIVRERQLGARAWAQLADPRFQSPEDMRRANRALLVELSGRRIQNVPAGSGFVAPLQPTDVPDPKGFLTTIFDSQKKHADGNRLIWELLPDSTKQWIVKHKEAGSPIGTELLDPLNELLEEKFLLLWPEINKRANEDGGKGIRAAVPPFLPQRERWTDFLFQRGVRLLNRLILEALCPQGIRPPPPHPKLPRVLAYESQGAVLGEMGLIDNQPRTATLVAYNHPEDDPEREVGPVQVVRIDEHLFDELVKASPEFRKHVEAVRDAHHAATRKREAEPLAPPTSPLLQTRQAEELGLIQGQKLMLIDLDRCTRCDECVQACVNTHNDGHTRLFLDGPRFGKYLVPTTCRSCLDPVCMIGCPVGSIHRGSNLQIVIENWCIGCGTCSEQCPYESIQMHDTGIIPQNARGWRYQLASRLGAAKWTQPRFDDRAWPIAVPPFDHDRIFRERLGVIGPLPADAVVCFRLALDVPRAHWNKPGYFRIKLVSKAEGRQLWLNGKPMDPSEKNSKEWYYHIEDAARQVTPGRNVIAVQMQAVAAKETLFALRLDRLENPQNQWGQAEQASQKAVDKFAVVCDLCSHLPSGPACVSACPHDAAMRVDAGVEFPGL
jgi:Fe-S-cluster-containing hydrogenase component 2/CRP-like cAMP-binding protein